MLQSASDPWIYRQNRKRLSVGIWCRLPENKNRKFEQEKAEQEIKKIANELKPVDHGDLTEIRFGGEDKLVDEQS